VTSAPPRLTYYDELGDDFERFMSEYDVERRVSLVFHDLLEGGALDGLEVLEVGSGTGRFSRELLKRRARLTAVDVGVRLARVVARGAAATGVAGDACRLPFRDESFDLVLSSECIEHTLDPEAAIAEMCRVARVGGRVCLTTPNRVWWPALLVALRLRLRRFDGIESWRYPSRVVAELARHSVDQGLTRSGCHLWPFQLAPTRPLLRLIDRWGRRLYPVMINFGVCGRKSHRGVDPAGV